jgi:hypothetical protein
MLASQAGNAGSNPAGGTVPVKGEIMDEYEAYEASLLGLHLGYPPDQVNMPDAVRLVFHNKAYAPFIRAHFSEDELYALTFPDWGT